jgi:DNA-binding GntR family transcriptional regulator
MLEKNGTIPIYIQLKNILKAAIMKGDYGQNEMIPSETQLAETYNITRTTVRRALSELVQENLLRKEHGKGTFVGSLKPISYSMWNFGSFTDYVQKKGENPTSKILTADVVQLDDKAYYKLERARGIKEEDEILYLTVDTSLIPLDLFPGIMAYDFEKQSLYEVMRKEYGIAPSIVELSIKPYSADHRIARVFGVHENTPLLMVKGQVSNEAHLEVEITHVIYSPNVDLRIVTRINSL